MIKQIFKTKKVLLLSLATPCLIFIWTFFRYINNPILCTYNLKEAVKCNSFLEYFFSISGIFYVFLILFSFIVSLLGILGLFLILNNRKKLGYTFLVIFTLIITCVVYIGLYAT